MLCLGNKIRDRHATKLQSFLSWACHTGECCCAWHAEGTSVYWTSCLQSVVPMTGTHGCKGLALPPPPPPPVARLLCNVFLHCSNVVLLCFWKAVLARFGSGMRCLVCCSNNAPGKRCWLGVETMATLFVKSCRVVELSHAVLDGCRSAPCQAQLLGVISELKDHPNFMANKWRQLLWISMEGSHNACIAHVAQRAYAARQRAACNLSQVRPVTQLSTSGKASSVSQSLMFAPVL